MLIQRIIVLVIVAVTVIIFLWRLSRPTHRRGCGGSCGSAPRELKKLKR